MQKVTFLVVGKIKTSWIVDGFEHFKARLQNQLSFEVNTILPSKNIDPKKMSEEESAKILEKVSSFQGDVWLLDEKGKSMTSPDFSTVIGKAKDNGTPLLFILGGPYGLTAEAKAKIKNHLQLSPMVFPHELCAVIFMEQLYRACEIQKGTGYHH